jgi:hypothetical protein
MNEVFSYFKAFGLECRENPELNGCGDGAR